MLESIENSRHVMFRSFRFFFSRSDSVQMVMNVNYIFNGAASIFTVGLTFPLRQQTKHRPNSFVLLSFSCFHVQSMVQMEFYYTLLCAINNHFLVNLWRKQQPDSTKDAIRMRCGFRSENSLVANLIKLLWVCEYSLPK